MRTERSRLAAWIIAAAIAAVTIAVFAQTAGFDFINYDDDFYVTANPVVKGGLTLENVRWAFGFREANWHPLTWISHMADVEMFGLWSGGHHLTNVLLHTLSALVLLGALVRMTAEVWKSGFVAAAYAVHPLRVESVAWVAERKDVLSAVFFMLALAAYAWYSERPGRGRYLLALGSYALGLMAKPMLVTLPIVLLLLDWWPLGRLKGTKARHAVLDKIPFFALAVVSAILTFLAQRAGQAVAPLALYPIGVRAANASVSVIAYVCKTVLPSGLGIFYPHPGDSLPAWQVAASAAAVVLVTGAAVAAGRKLPFVAVGWFWYAIMLLPVIGLVQVGEQAMADRYTYLPSIGLLLIAAWGLPAAVSAVAGARPAGPALGAAGVAALAALAVAAHHQAGFWQDSETVFRRTLAVTANNPRAHNSLGLALQEQGREEEAAREFERALALAPRYSRALSNYGQYLSSKGETEEGERLLREAIRLDPGLAEAHNNLGLALEARGEMDAAEREYREAIRQRPGAPGPHNNLGNVLMLKGQHDEAAVQYRAEIENAPRNAVAHYGLGQALEALGRRDEARDSYERALEIDPDHPGAHWGLGKALARERRYPEAIRHFERAVALMPNSAPMRTSLAIAYFLQGDYVRAWSQVRQIQESGGAVPENFLRALTEKMVAPGG